MNNGIFRSQPGLPSRCMWKFECDGYTGKQLSEIFIHQLREQGWDVSDKIKTEQLILDNRRLFKAYGRDTKRLIFFSQLAVSQNRFYATDSNNTPDNTLLTDDIVKGLEFLRENDLEKDEPINQEDCNKSNTSDEQLKHLLESLYGQPRKSRVEELND